jgi:hypothetical protein
VDEVGVPLNTPVLAFRERPAGKAGDTENDEVM